MTKSTKLILIGVGVLVVGLMVASAMGAFGKAEGIKVTAEKVEARTIIEVVNASGKVYPEIEVKVSPDISGEITQLNVQEGDTVKRGQILARIYADVYNIQRSQAATGVVQSQAQVANSRAALEGLQVQKEQAKKAYDMQKKLYDDKVISMSEFNVADGNYKTSIANYNAAVASLGGTNAAVQSARANLAKANTDLSRTTIIAPMDGVVSLLNVKVGEQVAGNSFNVGTEMLRIADMDKIEIRVDVGENDVPKVKLGDSALIDIDAYSGRRFKGIVTQIASSNNGAAGQSALAAASSDVTQYKVYVRILKESYVDLLGKGSFPFRPGMSANVDIQTKVVQDVISVPINAVTTRTLPDSVVNKLRLKSNGAEVDDQEVIVFVKDSADVVRKVQVKTGIQDINYIELTGGIKSGETVVTGPYDVVSKTLKEKDKVKVVDKKELFEMKKD